MHPDDVPDPHVLGMSWHDTAARQIEDAVCTAARLSARPIGLPFCDVEDAVEPPLHYAQQEFEVLGDR